MIICPTSNLWGKYMISNSIIENTVNPHFSFGSFQVHDNLFFP